MEETRRTVEEVLRENEEMRKEYMAKIEYLGTKHEEQIRELNAEIRQLNGVIEGLKFAIRCNGVSGGEVR